MMLPRRSNDGTSARHDLREGAGVVVRGSATGLRRRGTPVSWVPMPSLLTPADRDAILGRLRRLQPDQPALWGRFTAPAMVCHLADQLRVAVGDLPTRRHDNIASRTILKWLVVYSPLEAPRGKVQTAPEMLTSAPSKWAEDVGAVEALIHRLAATPTQAMHPFFGPLSHGAWGRLAWKHLDHHLRQFDC